MGVLLVKVKVAVVLVSERIGRRCREQSQGRAKGKLSCGDLHDCWRLRIVGGFEQKSVGS